MSKFCCKCGAQLNDAAMFCNNCGTKQEEATPKYEAQPSQDYQNTQSVAGTPPVSMSKFNKNPMRVISGILSAVSLIVILFGPLASHSNDTYNYFYLLNYSRSSREGVDVIILCCVFFSLFAAIKAIYGKKVNSKTHAIISNIVGLGFDLLLLFWATSTYDNIGVAIPLYIAFTIIAIIMLSISDSISFNGKSKNSTMTNAETLKRYKELLDSGAITKEEYENQKAILLKNINN